MLLDLWILLFNRQIQFWEKTLNLVERNWTVGKGPYVYGTIGKVKSVCLDVTFICFLGDRKWIPLVWYIMNLPLTIDS